MVDKIAKVGYTVFLSSLHKGENCDQALRHFIEKRDFLCGSVVAVFFNRPGPHTRTFSPEVVREHQVLAHAVQRSREVHRDLFPGGLHRDGHARDYGRKPVDDGGARHGGTHRRVDPAVGTGSVRAAGAEHAVAYNHFRGL